MNRSGNILETLKHVKSTRIYSFNLINWKSDLSNILFCYIIFSNINLSDYTYSAHSGWLNDEKPIISWGQSNQKKGTRNRGSFADITNRKNCL